MKKVLFSLAFLGLGLGATAQEVIWMDDFNDEDISDWTLIDADLDGKNWGDIFAITNQVGQVVTPVSLISRSWQGTPLTPDNWAISPAIDLSNVTGTVELSYITQVAAADWDQEVYSLYVGTSSNPDDLLNAEIQLKETLGDANHTGTPVNHTLDISTLAGESEVYIAFRHHDVTDMDFISVDDVTVTGQLGVSDVASQKSDLAVVSAGKGLFQVQLPKNFDANKTSVEVYNVNGAKVSTGAYKANLNLANLPAGVYILKAVSGKEVVTTKFVKK